MHNFIQWVSNGEVDMYTCSDKANAFYAMVFHIDITMHHDYMWLDFGLLTVLRSSALRLCALLCIYRLPQCLFWVNEWLHHPKDLKEIELLNSTTANRFCMLEYFLISLFHSIHLHVIYIPLGHNYVSKCNVLYKYEEGFKYWGGFKNYTLQVLHAQPYIKAGSCKWVVTVRLLFTWQQ